MLSAIAMAIVVGKIISADTHPPVTLNHGEFPLPQLNEGRMSAIADPETSTGVRARGGHANVDYAENVVADIVVNSRNDQAVQSRTCSSGSETRAAD
jgi:hypothetical protein